MLAMTLAGLLALGQAPSTAPNDDAPPVSNAIRPPPDAAEPAPSDEPAPIRRKTDEAKPDTDLKPDSEAKPEAKPETKPQAEPAKTESPTIQINLTTLDLLRRKGLITEADFAQAKNDLAEWGDKAGTAPTFLIGKFATTLYGFLEADFIHDDTRSFIDLAGNSAIQPINSEAGSNSRTMFGVRNSRLGFRLQAPEEFGIHPSGFIEADFLGNQPGTPPLTSSSSTFKEGSWWTNPTFRIRHAVLKLDNDFVNVWLGQTWELVGFQSAFQPNTVEIQGIPGELYSRTPQIRLLHDFKFGDMATLELAVAALRPPQEDAQVPDLQFGVRLAIDGWKGRQTIGSTGTALQPASIAISGGTRTFTLATGPSKTTWNEQTAQGEIIAGDIMIPAIPPSMHLPIALTLVAESTFGTGDSDLFTSLTGGVGVGTPAGYPACPTAGVACYPASYNAGIDPGMVGFNTKGRIELVDWRSVLVGMQLYLPPDYRLWISANYSNMYSDNTGDFGSSTVGLEWFADVNVFFDITSSVRLGVEYAHFADDFVNGTQASNNRLQFSGFFIF